MLILFSSLLSLFILLVFILCSSYAVRLKTTDTTGLSQDTNRTVTGHHRTVTGHHRTVTGHQQDCHRTPTGHHGTTAKHHWTSQDTKGLSQDTTGPLQNTTELHRIPKAGCRTLQDCHNTCKCGLQMNLLQITVCRPNTNTKCVRCVPSSSWLNTEKVL